ncbi:MAG: adenosine deaminase [Micropruina sp.]|uniref:adenosine deaminase n=1 Tax=Micropruina sp. TaxID=2737536 RepID=UPI0039E6F427
MTAWAELHLHLEGTLEPELIFALAERNDVRLPYADLDDLRSRYDFTDLQSFLDLYYTNMQVLRTEQDFADLTDAYLARAQRAGIKRAEVFFDLQAHTARGVAPEVALGGVHRALDAAEERYGISAGLILTFLRHLPAEEATTAYQQVVDSGVPLLGVGLCSTELGYPTEPFAEVFARARADGLRTVAHAGEEGDASYVRLALDVLGVERVDHGVRAVEDDELIERLIAERMPLTMCPLSNVRLKVVPDLAAHPIVGLLRRGVRVTVNSDDPAYFGGYLDDVVAALREAFALSEAEIAQLARNSIEASFASDVEKARLLGEGPGH